MWYLFLVCTDQSLQSTYQVIVYDLNEIRARPLVGVVQVWEWKLETNVSHVQQANVKINPPGNENYSPLLQLSFITALLY